MTDENAHILQQRVTSYLESKDGRALDIGSPSHLTLLVQYARSGVSAAPEDEIWMTVAMCWLGPPPSAGIPPAFLREELHQVMQQLVPDEQERLERIMEFTIAYGCGKWREVRLGSGGWEHRWQGAMRGLVRALEPAVAQSNRWLAEHVVGFPSGRQVSHNERFTEDTGVWSDAWLLATRFIRPEYPLHLQEHDILAVESTPEGTVLEVVDQDYQAFVPPGAKAAWTVYKTRGEAALVVATQRFPLTATTTIFLITRDDDVIVKAVTAVHEQQARLKNGETAEITGSSMLLLRECTCGTTHCVERHRLTAWNPQQTIQKKGHTREQKVDAALTLWDCVASAVKGPQATLMTGAFVQGMYFPLLAKEGVDQ